jgi:hypothetical protein
LKCKKQILLLVVKYYTTTGTGNRAPTTLKSEGEVTSLSGADKREVRDNREKW